MTCHFSGPPLMLTDTWRSSLGKYTVFPSTLVQVHSMVGIGYPVASHTRATFFPILSLAFSGPETITGAEKMYSYYVVKLANNC